MKLFTNTHQIFDYSPQMFGNRDIKYLIVVIKLLSWLSYKQDSFVIK